MGSLIGDGAGTMGLGGKPGLVDWMPLFIFWPMGVLDGVGDGAGAMGRGGKCGVGDGAGIMGLGGKAGLAGGWVGAGKGLDLVCPVGGEVVFEVEVRFLLPLFHVG